MSLAQFGESILKVFHVCGFPFAMCPVVAYSAAFYTLPCGYTISLTVAPGALELAFSHTDRLAIFPVTA